MLLILLPNKSLFNILEGNYKIPHTRWHPRKHAKKAPQELVSEGKGTNLIYG